jgi:hypothetical protein
MNVQQINRVSSTMIIILSVTALLAVLSGYFQAPQPDEGSAAHISQLSIGLLVPLVLAFLVTVDWTRPLPGMRRLIPPAVVLVIAFAALYYLEHYYYLARYR